MKSLAHSIRLLLWLTLSLGVVYPLGLTALAQFTFPFQAGGSLLTRDGKLAGSALLAQNFTQDKYFWPRPSAVEFNPLASGGSNLSPASAELMKQVQARRERLVKAWPTDENVPQDLLFTSASGLDPEIAPEAARYQIPRIARARGLPETAVQTLVAQNIRGRQMGFLGEPRVNVLRLNLALDGEK